MGTAKSGWFRADPTRCRSGKHLIAEVGEMRDGHCKGCLKEWRNARYAKHRKAINAKRRAQWKEKYVPHPIAERTHCGNGHEYAVTGRHSDGHCAECRRRRDRKRWYRRTGVAVQTEYERLLVVQDGLCAVCRQPETRLHRGRVCRLTFDHDHATGQTRGLLCHKCNVALGMLREDPIVIRHMLDYLSVSLTHL
jgi:hypothetical protein